MLCGVCGAKYILYQNKIYQFVIPDPKREFSDLFTTFYPNERYCDVIDIATVGSECFHIGVCESGEVFCWGFEYEEHNLYIPEDVLVKKLYVFGRHVMYVDKNMKFGFLTQHNEKEIQNVPIEVFGECIVNIKVLGERLWNIYESRITNYSHNIKW